MSEPDIFERAGLQLTEEQKAEIQFMAQELHVASRGLFGLVELMRLLTSNPDCPELNVGEKREE